MTIAGSGGFNRSLLRVSPTPAWRWTTPPTYNPDGSILTPGIKQTLNGVFILFSDELIALLRENLTQAEKDELATWVNRYTNDQLGTWNMPGWSGQNGAVYARVPAAVWNDPATEPPAKVKKYFAALWRAATT